MKRLAAEIKLAWLPQEIKPLADWLEAHLKLPAEDSPKPGYYQTASVPYFWGIMHALDSPDCWMVVSQKAAQIGWTVLLAGWICKLACTDPSRILMLFPKEEKGRKFMDEKLVPIVRESPDVARVIDVTTSRKGGSRTTQKSFPGGWVQAIGSNSPSNVISTSARRAVVEEPDNTNRSVGDQGDSIKNLLERLKVQPEKKVAIGGTPTVADLSIVEHYAKMGTLRVLPVTCHECGESHVLDWGYVDWEKRQGGTEHPIFGLNQPDTAYYCCPHCGTVWDDWQRKQNILDTCRGAYESGDPFAGWIKTQCTDGYGPDDIEPVESFHELGELYVCMDGTSLASVVRAYLEAKHEADAGDEGALIVFENNKLGRTYRYQADQHLDPDELQDAAEDYPLRVCPEGGLMVCAGVDVQHDRVAITIRAYGRDEESWQMHWGEIDGDTADKTDPVWDALDELLFNPFEHEKFGEIMLAGVTIDSSDGATSNAVYHWVRTRSKKYPKCKILAGKGWSTDYGEKEIFSSPRQIDRRRHDKPSKADRHGVKVYMMGTHKAKEIITRRLTGTSAYMHSNANVRTDYWKQVTAEVKAPDKRRSGKLTWHKLPARPNEGLDTEVYALHNAHANGMHKLTAAKWDEIEARLAQRTLFSPAPTTPAKPQPRQGQTTRRGGVGKSSWGSKL